MSHPWEKALKESDYYDLIGAYDKELGRRSSGALYKFKNEVMRLLDNENVDWDKVYHLCPEFDINIDDLLKILFSKSIKPILFFDFPANVNSEYNVIYDGDLLTFLYQSIKDFQQYYCPKPEHLSEIYFLTQESYNEIQNPQTSFVRSDFDTIQYEPYAPVETFAILSRHHAPKTIGSAGFSRLDGVLAGEFLQLAWNKNKTLLEIIQDMKTEIVEGLNVPWDDVPAGKLNISKKQAERLVKKK